MDRLSIILNREYYLIPHAITPQQGGWAALAYRVDCAGGNRYFLKAYEKGRASTPKWTALIGDYMPVLLWLERETALQGRLPAPVLTKDGGFSCQDDEAVYLLFAYIEGVTLADPLSESRLTELARLTAILHAHGGEIAVDTAPIREDFHIPFLADVDRALGGEWAALPRDIKAVCEADRDRILALSREVAVMAGELMAAPPEFVLCHTDLHAGNLMERPDGTLILLDWEGLRLAPREADFMSFSREEWGPFFRAYRLLHPACVVNELGLRFYQGRRKLEDIWEFIEQLLYDSMDAAAREGVLDSLRDEIARM